MTTKICPQHNTTGFKQTWEIGRFSTICGKAGGKKSLWNMKSCWVYYVSLMNFQKLSGVCTPPPPIYFWIKSLWSLAGINGRCNAIFWPPAIVWLDSHIITQPHSEVCCGYFRRLVFGNSLTFSNIPPCFHAKPPDFPRLIGPREHGLIGLFIRTLCPWSTRLWGVMTDVGFPCGWQCMCLVTKPGCY